MTGGGGGWKCSVCVCVCSSRVHLCFARLTHEVMIKKWLKGEDNLLKQHGCHLVRHTWTLADVFKSGSNLKKKIVKVLETIRALCQELN